MDEMLAARGWAEGSPEHLLFARRMSFADATGGYALSNVLGSVGAGLACLGLGFVGTRLRDRGTLTAAGVVGVGGLLVWLTASRGAMGALMLGVVWFGVAWWLGGRIKWGWLRSVVVVGLGLGMVAVPWLAIGWAGAQGPPPPPLPGEVASFPGWLSLLFRYWYLEAGVRMLMEVPGVWWSAVGPAGFSLMFGWMKDPMLPEDVASTHNVVVDLLVMLGVYGLCWLVLGGWWLWRGMCPSRAADVESGGKEERHVSGEPNWLGGMAASGVLLLPVVWMTVETLYLETAFLQLLVFAGMAVAVAWLAELGKGVSARVMGMGLAAGALVLVVHGQMEMTFFNGGASQLAWVVLGLAGGVGSGVKATGRECRWICVAMAVLTVLALSWIAWSVSRVEGKSFRVAEALVDGRSHLAMDLLAFVADRRLGESLDQDLERWFVRLRLEHAYLLREAGRRAEALGALLEAERGLPVSHDVKDRHRRLYATIYEERARLTDGAEGRESLEATAYEWGVVIDRSPYSVRDRLRLVEVLIELEGWDEAAAELEKARGINDGLYLDPLKQLPEGRFEGLERRIEAGRGE
ncbi:MAG: O-antigen ligase family protein [Phycisphaeraceae bacterium]